MIILATIHIVKFFEVLYSAEGPSKWYDNASHTYHTEPSDNRHDNPDTHNTCWHKEHNNIMNVSHNSASLFMLKQHWLIKHSSKGFHKMNTIILIFWHYVYMYENVVLSATASGAYLWGVWPLMWLPTSSSSSWTISLVYFDGSKSD